ncbi:MAG: SGNH/GDSL hydrolase family protein [Gemmatimonadales bacterium]
MMSHSTRARILAAVISIGAALAALYGLEALFTIASPAWIDKLGTTLRRGPNVLDETRRMRAAGISAYPYLQPDTFTDSALVRLRIAGDTLVAPLAGIPSELTILCTERGPTVGYRSDSLGFRNPAWAWAPEPDIALIGDSFAQGFCVSESESVAGGLRSAGWRTVTTGLAGAGPITELGIVREYLRPLEPRLVLWMFYEGNDLIDIWSEKKTLLARYLDPSFSQNLAARAPLLREAMKTFADSAIRAHPAPGFADHLRAFVTLRRLRTATGLNRQPTLTKSADEKGDLETMREVLSQAQSDVASWGGELRLVYLPERRRFNAHTAPIAGENHDPRAVHRDITAIASALGIPVIDVATAFAREDSPSTLWNSRRLHYNARGYKAVTEAIVSSLAKNHGR